MSRNKKLNFEELKELVFKLNKATKQNKDRLFKLAKANKNLETIKKLRDEFSFKGAKLYLDKLDSLSLDEVIKNKDVKLLKKLIEEGVKTSHINIAELVKQDYNIKFIEFLIDNGSNINARAETSIGELGFTALITASYWGNYEIVKLLCEVDAKLDNQDVEGATALFLSIQHKHIEIVDILLEYGADINIQLNTGASPLMTAVVNNNYLMIEKILKNHGDIHLKFSDKKYPYYNYTALDIAYEEKQIKQSELINKGKVFIYEGDNGREELLGRPSIIGLLRQYNNIIELLEDSYLTSSVFINECFEKANSTITSPFIAERFILEELDSATGGNKEAQKWAKKCGYKEHEYLGALSKSLPEVDGAEGPQQILSRLIFPYFVKDMSNENRHALVANVRRKVIDKIMKYHSLGKYQENIKRIQLNNFNIIDVYNDYLIFDNNKYENLLGVKYFNLEIQTYIEVESEVVIFSYVDYNNEKEEDTFEIINTTKLHDKVLIITEGKTDWKHLKKALKRFHKAGIYLDLNIEFKEYENEISMSDSELVSMVINYSKILQLKKHIMIFDRDATQKKDIKKIFKKENSYNSHGNNVYSVFIPEIDNTLTEICIEFYYKQEEVKKAWYQAKRLFYGNEFDKETQISICGKYKTDKPYPKLKMSLKTLI